MCWPGVGTVPTRAGVFESLIVAPGRYISPATASSRLTSISRSHRCGSLATSGMVRTGATGMPAASSSFTMSSTLCAAHHASIFARRSPAGELPASGVSSAGPPTIFIRRPAMSRPAAAITTQPSLALYGGRPPSPPSAPVAR